MYDSNWVWFLAGLMAVVAGSAGCTASTDAPAGSTESAVLSVELQADSRVLGPGETTTVDAVLHESGEEGSSASDDSTSVSDLQWEWSVSNDAWGIEGSGDAVILKAPDSRDSHTSLDVRIRNSEGVIATDDLLVQTVRNRAPQIVNLTAMPHAVEAGGAISLTAEANDPDGDDLTYEWSAPDGWTLGSKKGKEVELQAPDQTGELARVGIQISDGSGGTTHHGLQVRTLDASQPNISGMIASPPQVARGGTTEVSVDATDPAGGELSYSWMAPSDWSVDGTGETVDVTAPDQYGARGEISVEVSNEDGQSVTGRIVVATAENGGPTLSSLTADPQQIPRSGTADLEALADDPNGDTLSYNWSVSDSAWSVSGNGNTAVVDPPDQPGASARVDVEVSDADGKTALASIIVSTVPNGSPSLGSLSANPARISPGGTSQLEAAASDPDGDQLSYSWTTPQGWSVSGQTSDPTLQAPSGYGNTAVITVQVDDGFGGTASGSVAVTTTRNTPPVISNVTADPLIVSKGGTTTVSASASDPDGDSLNYSWTVPSGWTQNGSGESIDVQAPDQFDAQATFEVTVTDGNGGQTTGAATAQTERNEPPIVVSVTADQTTLSPGGSTKVYVEAVDPEGHSLNYTWNLPSGWSKSGSGDTITVTAPNNSGETGKIEVNVSDGYDSVSDSITLQTS